MIRPTILHSVARYLWLRRIRFIPGAVTRLNYFITGCDISPKARIGKRVHFQHFGSGVVIHCNVEIGDDVWIMPHVVLGQNVRGGKANAPEGMLIRIGDGVVLGAGAKVIADGRLEIGDHAVVGANAVVLKSIPADRVAVGIPAVIRDNRMKPKVL